ncbi:hypothetical protein, partial [Pseudomonas syringae group genomosp. 7]|uniref:hypothetical protein n=1 Tax=Pseudomonas syringae group genomosp. 7 TaxID=251699 RepID=UPI003770191C
PHCPGTHTECIGHLLPVIRNVTVLDIPLFIAATLIHVSLERVSETKEGYNVQAAADDRVVTAEAIEHAMAPLGSD